MKKKFHNSSGSVAPLAILFTFLSMLLIAAYLGQSSTIATMEKYRFAELRAQYVAEAGLNREAVDYLPYLDADTTILVGKQGMEFGEDSDGDPLGVYKNISCYTQLMDGSTRKEFVAKSTGEVNYASTVGSTVTVQKTVFMSMVPSGFEEFMYFTNDEEPFGPNPSSFVSFGDGDELEGRVHTNSPTVTFSEWGCPEFTGTFTVTEPISYEGDTGCLDEMEDEDGVSIIDTVESIIFPPDNSIGILKANATRVFTADDMITFSPTQKDTLIMTEIEFDESGGFWATQWWYLVPPVVEDASTSIGFYYDSIEVAAPFSPIEPYSLGLVLADGTDAYDPVENYDNAVWLYVSTNDINGNDNTAAMSTFESNDVVSIESEVDPDKKVDFTILNSNQVSSFLWRLQINTFLPINYEGPPGIGFLEDEPVTLSRQGSSSTLNAHVPFNEYQYFHNHSEPTGFGGPNENTICQADGFQHFDFRYWLCNDRYSVNGCYEDLNGDGEYDENEDKSFVLFQRTFFPYSGPEVIYIKGGQVLVHGTVKGAYTVVTDYVIEYRRHDNPIIVDQIWGNIWLIDDIRYEDSNTSSSYLTDGEVMHPDDGGTDNVLGLVAGSNIIIANTTPNGARNRYLNPSSRHIVINGALMALQGAFISHYWQNSVQSGQCFYCAQPNPGDVWENSLGDGRGGHRNPVRDEGLPGAYTNNQDNRGKVNLWGSIVQQERGYMMRNNPGPYTSGDIGYEKNYHYDYNLLDNPPPYYPDQSTVSGVIVLKIKSYGTQPGS